MMNHVLIPLDGSELAREAIEPAKHLIQPNGSITLLMVVDELRNWDFGVNPAIVFEQTRRINDELMPRAKAYLEEIAFSLRREGFLVDTLVQFGDAAMVILETAASCKVDTIAISTHGRTGFSRLFFGSVTNKVISAASCPVFVVPNKPHIPEAEEPAAALASP